MELKKLARRCRDTLYAMAGHVVAAVRDRKQLFKYNLVAGAIFKNEARDLHEWLTFHAGVGIEHFYLYNNFSTDNYRQVLEPWIRAGLVTLTDWPLKAGQMQAYADCKDKHKNETCWMVFIDIDEFLFSPRHKDIREVLKSYSDLPGLFVYWVLFGSSGHDARPPGHVLENYTWRLDEHTANTEKHPKGVTGKSRQGKSIFNPRIVRKVDHCCPIMWKGKVLDSELHLPPRFSARPKVTWDTIRINHYWSKSLEDVREKVGRGQAKNGNARDLERFIAREKSLNVEQDFTVQQLWRDILAAAPAWQRECLSS